MSKDRQEWLSTLAKAPPALLARLWATTGMDPRHELVRAPEIGSVMARGRIGATGAPFNLGEVSVTRCSVRLATGEVGHGYVQGRDKEKAARVALIDAAMQTAAADSIRLAVLGPLIDAATAAKSARAGEAAATKVDFFTMVRGED